MRAGQVLSEFSDGAFNFIDLMQVERGDPDYRRVAAWAGYGDDFLRYGREHDLAHHVIAWAVGWRWSPAIYAARAGAVQVPLAEASPLIRRDEHLAGRLQRLARAGIGDEMGILGYAVVVELDELVRRFDEVCAAAAV